MKQHNYHILPYSPWPLIVGLSAFIMMSGFGFYIKELGGELFLLGLAYLMFAVYFWFLDIIDESTNSGFHTNAVRMGLQMGFILFLISEIMLFFGFFWAFFHGALSASIETGGIFPPEGLYCIPALELPLYNTYILIFSGVSVTWAHRAVGLGCFKDAIDSLLLTIALGFLFVILQMFEYYETTFTFSDSVYGCSFFMLTGLHGCHVIVGSIFLLISLIRLLKRQYLRNHYLGFVFAIWYWHFVDIVWIFLFISVYCWGSW